MNDKNEKTSGYVEEKKYLGERSTKDLFELLTRVLGQGNRVTYQKSVDGIGITPDIAVRNIPEFRFGFEEGKLPTDLVLNYGDSHSKVDGSTGRKYESWVTVKNKQENGVGFSVTDGVSRTIKIFTLGGI